MNTIKYCEDCGELDAQFMEDRPCPACGSRRYTVENDEEYEPSYEDESDED